MKREMLEKALAHATYTVGLLQAANDKHACADGKPSAARIAAQFAAERTRREIVDALDEISMSK